MRKAFILLMFLGYLGAAHAQKKPLDHSVYDSWKSIANTQLTSDGKFLLYEVNPQEGDGKLIVRRNSDGSELVIPRGYKAQISKDNLTASLNIKAPYAEIRKARNKNVKKDMMPKDSLAIIDLEKWSIEKYDAIKTYKTGIDNSNFLAYIQLKKSEKKQAPDAEKKKKKKKKKAEQEKLDGDILVVINRLTGKKTYIKNVSSYEFNTDASSLAILVNPDKKNKKLKSSAKLYDLTSMNPTLLSEGKKYYGHARFSQDGKQLVFLASTDTTTTGNKHCSLFYVKNAKANEKSKEYGKAQEIIPQSYSKNLPASWSLNENSAPEFSGDGKRILLGIAPYIAPKDTSIIEAETAQVDIWNYQDFQIQPQQKVNLEKNKKKVYEAVIHLDDSQAKDKSLGSNASYEIVPLTTAMWDKITLMNEGNAEWALSQDRTAYYIQSQWDDDNYTDLALVNMKTGERKLIAKKVNTRAQASPDGKYVIWYDMDDADFHAYHIKSGKLANLTKATKVNFYDEEDDHPNKPSAYCMRPLWTENDESVLIHDRYDIWKFNPDGSGFENLTQGQGRARRIQLRPKVYDQHPRNKATFWDEKEAVNNQGKLYMTTFDEETKRNGFATVNLSEGKTFQVNLLDTFTYTNVYKAEKADRIVYQKGNFTQANNLYLSDANFQQEKCLSDINPQQKEYSWGKAQLVHWNAYDGTPLDGLLYVPENVDSNKKYPMMIYFYEKRSETLYNYIEPRPSRSTVNIPFYCSRGYVVFVPDIVYQVGHPGESAYNCIVSGAKAMCQQFQFVDSTKMAIQGQSWGGYQTAYLVTRTNLFCAAGAGAPVSNMTSAYGGIRWGSGVCRQMQYEHGQSRIGSTLWDKGGLDLYIENSPLFKADQVTTPLLIMHNDNDGAVPWYQGIEYFMALRRLGKKVWMLEYNKEEHNLVERRNCKDLSIRLQQFFDHYMKGAPEPAWMKYGVPATRKGQYLGTETE